MDEERIKELFSDEAFVNSILEMETPEEVQKALAEKGIDLTIDEICTIQKSLSQSDGELSEDDLENVAGGSIIATLIIVAAGIAGAASLGKAVHGWTRRRW